LGDLPEIAELDLAIVQEHVLELNVAVNNISLVTEVNSLGSLSEVSPTGLPGKPIVAFDLEPIIQIASLQKVGSPIWTTHTTAHHNGPFNEHTVQTNDADETERTGASAQQQHRMEHATAETARSGGTSERCVGACVITHLCHLEDNELLATVCDTVVRFHDVFELQPSLRLREQAMVPARQGESAAIEGPHRTHGRRVQESVSESKRTLC
jgi:hypothetical protein